jgi:hypothetical protein
MNGAPGKLLAAAVLLFASLLCTSCGKPSGGAATGEDPNVTTLGTIEVTARLVEIPRGAIFKKDLYNYTTILKYQVLKTHRGQVKGDTIYVGHYNPWKARNAADDDNVKGIGGNLSQFQAGQVHRMALEAPIDDFYMGGIINKYFEQKPDPIYWAVWTNSAKEK